MSLQPRYVSACFITKDPVYPKPIWDAIHSVGFGEILMLTRCDSPHRKQELFAKAKFDYVYYQDDDCLAPIEQLFTVCKPGIITCAMKAGHIERYKNSRIALLGWGSIFPRKTIYVLDQYRAVHGEDEIYRRETERIMTALAFPQLRVDLPVTDLPSADAPDRLSMQPGHYSYIQVVEDRVNAILAAQPTGRILETV